MRDLLIGFGYFGFCLLVAISGVCLIVKPRRFSLWFSRPLLGRRSEESQEWSEVDASHWRTEGILRAIGGAFMFLLPILFAVHSRTDRDSSAAPQVPQFHSIHWIDYLFFTSVLCFGSALIAKPLRMLRFFHSKERPIVSSSPRDLIGPRIVGVLFILFALFCLVQVGRH